MLAVRVRDVAWRVGDDDFACLIVDAVAGEQLGVRARTLFDAMAARLRARQRQQPVAFFDRQTDL